MSNSMIEKVNALIAAPSCCAELRAVAEEWLKAVGTDGEKEASAKLIAELEEDVCTLEKQTAVFTACAPHARQALPSWRRRNLCSEV